MLPNGIPASNSISERSAFATIDDAIQLSQTLLTHLKTIGTYKHPLAVRRGVMTMTDTNKTVQSKTVKAGAITYFLDIKHTKDDQPYLVITESRYKGEDKNRERKQMLVFKEHAQEFSQAVSEMTASLQ